MAGPGVGDTMRCLLLLAALGCGVAAQVDPLEIVRRSLAAEEAEDEKLVDGFAFVEREQTKQLGSDGAVKSVSSRTNQVMVIDGSPYRSLLARDDKPVAAEGEAAQREDPQRVEEARRKEPAADRARRQEDYERRRHKYRKALREIPDAFTFRLRGEEKVDARPVYVIEVTPRSGYHPTDRYSKLFPALKGTLWIDKTDYRWVRLRAELAEGVNFGWILVRISKGARVEFDRSRVNDEVWLPDRLWFVVSMRIGLLKAYNVEQETTYRDYRKRGSRSQGFELYLGPQHGPENFRTMSTFAKRSDRVLDLPPRLAQDLCSQ